MSSNRENVLETEGDRFQFPEEGSFLHEAVNGIRTPLMNEDWDDQDAGSDDTVPVRILTDFVLFDPRTLRLVPLSCLSDGSGFCEAFGLASAEPDENESDEDDWDDTQDNRILLHLTNIMKWSLNLHQENIWIHTQYAWYILKYPSPRYRPFFIPFYTKETLLRIVLRNLLRDPSLTSQKFLHLLSLPAAQDYLLGRCWTEEDLASNFQYSRLELRDIVHKLPDIIWEDIQDASLLDTLLRDSGTSSHAYSAQKDFTPSKSHHGSTHVSRLSPLKPKAKKIRTSRTTVSHIINSLVSPFYDTKFAIVGQKPDFLNEAMLLRERPQDQEQVSAEFMYSLKPGDFVTVNEGDYFDASQIRFAQVVFLNRRGKTFHARWFVHGSQTVLEEVAFGQELFLSVADDCSDVAVDCVIGKCSVTHISLEQRSTLRWPAKDRYFFSSAWDRNNPTDFLEVKDDQIQIAVRPCKACDSRNSAFSCHLSGSCLNIQDQDYHKYDFIRYQATDHEQSTCSFGQIIAFHDSGESIQIRMHRLGRVSDRTKSLCTENELFMTPIEVVVNPTRVLGICQVTHISQFKKYLTDYKWLDQHPLSFYIQYQAVTLDGPFSPLPLTALNICDTCKQDKALELQCRQELSLRAFDPFCGVGGLGMGLARGCSMHTSHGVELDSSAAETMRRNFPETSVLNEDACQVLRDIIKKRPGVPHHGDVDLMYTSPPFQNDSTLNRYKTDRKCLVFVALSFLDILRPPIFIMVAVPGLLQWQVIGTVHKIRAGDLKMVLKTLHFLGYNVRGRLLHARSFGDPQTRSRYVIVATLPKCGDFSFPEVTHTFKPGHSGLVTGLGQDLKMRVAVAPAGCALHEAVTISGAISDLPLFDWTYKPAASKHKEEAATDSRNVATVSCDANELWGIKDAAFRYRSPPRNLFQHRARRDLGLSDPQYQHFTKHFNLNVVRKRVQTVVCVCDIPLVRGADYRHLDQKNREWLLRDPASSQAIGGFQSGAYTRLDPNGYFQTIVTNVAPTAKQAAILHPDCKRVLTVRELARAQGFPDDFVFYSETDNINDYHKQIGNSVPFGMSTALGRSIQDIVFRNWELEKKRQR